MRRDPFVIFGFEMRMPVGLQPLEHKPPLMLLLQSLPPNTRVVAPIYLPQLQIEVPADCHYCGLLLDLVFLCATDISENIYIKKLSRLIRPCFQCIILQKIFQKKQSHVKILVAQLQIYLGFKSLLPPCCNYWIFKIFSSLFLIPTLIMFRAHKD